ncbi:MAG: FecR domain-containing protein, partial [Planctomycetota bacterium]|nr:FecR domain-containing protein [Planctomycetota bacterium]
MADAPAPHSPLTCHEAEREIDLLIEDGDLKETERALLFAHVRACQACKSKLEARRRQDVRLRQAFVALDTSPDFTRRVLESLPAAAAGDPASEAAWAAAERVVRQERRGDARPLGLGWLTRGYRLPAVLAALISIGLLGAYLRFQWLKDMPEEVAQIQEMSGAGVRTRAGREARLEAGNLLRRGDEIAAGTDGPPLVLKLGFRGTPVAAVQLKPGALLRAYSRSQYTLVKGEAYFQVRKDRPKDRPGERFKVETTLGCVQVLGTEFGIIVPSEVPQMVTVVVGEGTVEVVPNSGNAMRLEAGDEGDLLNAGGTSGPRPAYASRLT